MFKPTIYILVLTATTWAAFMKNKYLIEVDSIEVCPNNEKLVNPIRNLKFTKINRTQKALSLDFSYNRPIGEGVGGTLSVEKLGDGGWKPIPFIGFQKNICESFLNYFADIWVAFNAKIGVQHPDKCPIPKGNYSLKNFVIDTADVKIPFWSGTFRFQNEYEDIQTKEALFCLRTYMKINEVLI